MVEVGSQKYIKMFRKFLSHYGQIWLKQFTNDHHLGYITKSQEHRYEPSSSRADYFKGLAFF
jgi:hypothetical protein